MDVTPTSPNHIDPIEKTCRLRLRQLSLTRRKIPCFGRPGSTRGLRAFGRAGKGVDELADDDSSAFQHQASYKL
jgi:hypothetical protein